MTEKTDNIDTKEAPTKWISIDQTNFKLEVFRRELDETEFVPLYGLDVAVGLEEYPTPNGKFVMLRKAKYPDWLPPDREWVGPELRDPNTGKPLVVDGRDPGNPIRGAFLDLGDGIGIHGTSNLASIGTRASHGCIRVTEEQALELYRRIPVGTVVEIF